MLPLLKPVIAVILVVRLADAFRIFDVVYVLTGSGPANSTDVLSTYIYRQMFTVFDFPGGAAAPMLLVLITAAFSLLAVLLLRDRRGRADEPPATSPRQPRRCRNLVFLVVVCLLVLVPIYWIVATSIKPTSEILVTPTNASHRAARRSTTTASRSPAISAAISSTA